MMSSKRSELSAANPLRPPSFGGREAAKAKPIAGHLKEEAPEIIEIPISINLGIPLRGDVRERRG